MSEAEFWSLTPRQFDALHRQHREAQRREDFRYGVLASVVANGYRNPKTKPVPFEPADFFDVPRAGPVQQSPEQIKATMLGIFGAAGVEVVYEREAPP